LRRYIMEAELDDARAVVMALAAPLWTGALALVASTDRAALRGAMPVAGASTRPLLSSI
jgi:hypothetical protein